MNPIELFIIAFILGIFVFMIRIYVESKNSEYNYIRSTVDNQKYLVRNVGNQKEAANMLAEIRKRLIKFCAYLQKQYPNDKRIIRTINRFTPDNIYENYPEDDSESTSYSMNKGEKIYFCLRDKVNKSKFVNLNVVMFVAFHEMAHVMSLSTGHTEEFWDNFKFILKNAVKLGVYKYIDFASKPFNYCGVKITTSPWTPNK